MIALVLGGAACRWDDVDRLEAMVGSPWPGIVIGVNEACCKPDSYGRGWTRRFDALATLHTEKVVRWKHARRQFVRSLGRSPLWDHYEVWGHTNRSAVDRNFHGWPGGSSGLYAVSVALEMGAAGVVVCGCPIDDQDNAFRGERWHAFKRYRKGWKKQRRLGGLERVRSMSGWTAELCGEPDREWLGEGVSQPSAA